MGNSHQTPFNFDNRYYTRLMAQNLPTLRASLGLSQSDLAGIIGVTRQTLSATESGARELSWGNFISLLYVFTQNERTVPLLEALGIYTEELAAVFRVADLSRFGQPDGPGAQGEESSKNGKK